MKRKRKIVSILFAVICICVILSLTVISVCASVGAVGSNTNVPISRSFMNFGLTAVGPNQSSTGFDVGYPYKEYYIGDITSQLLNSVELWPNGAPTDITISDSTRSYIASKHYPNGYLGSTSPESYYRFYYNGSLSYSNVPHTINVYSSDSISIMTRAEMINLGENSHFKFSYLLPLSGHAEDSSTNLNFFDYYNLDFSVSFSYLKYVGETLYNIPVIIDSTDITLSYNGNFTIMYYNSVAIGRVYYRVKNPCVVTFDYFDYTFNDLSYFNLDYCIADFYFDYNTLISHVAESIRFSLSFEGGYIGVCSFELNNLNCSLKDNVTIDDLGVSSASHSSSALVQYYYNYGYFPILYFSNHQPLSMNYQSNTVDYLNELVQINRTEIGSSLFDWLGDTIGGVLDVEIFGFASLSDILLVIMSIGLFVLVLKYFAGG